MTASEWRKSSYSGNDSNCVEVSPGPATGLRDSKHPDSGHIVISAPAFRAFVRSLKRD
ncbi:DUF397 domain-containing protein [Actinosynnema sp. NPDC050436]|uniref:DUF397 domain-containing protein n=1 Tax=Actinosynnema sp. NPDC050436 TaxID=3155659 RepID=UPI0033EF621A